MKSKKIKFLETVLRWMASAVINKYNPTIIGITGSVGKTSAKEAVFAVLSSKFRVRKNEKNYNNEIGLPLTIIGAESGHKSIGKWFKVFFKWMAVIILPFEYPEILILEMGVDRPGDMKYLLSFIPVKIGIVTGISSSHLEYFNSLDHIAREKGRIIEVLPEEGTAILNSDDKRVMGMAGLSKAGTLSYGIKNQSQILATDINYHYQEGKLAGIGFKLNYEGKTIPMRLPHIIAQYQVYSTLAAAAAGIVFKINLVEIATTLENFFSPCGRMKLIEGMNGSLIIDDTYNASPTSALAALEVLNDIEAGRKIAVLGDMLELGEETQRGHLRIASKLQEMQVDLFMALGDRMETTVQSLKKNGYPEEKFFHFSDHATLVKKLKAEIKAGDLILIKGSQGMRMEKIAENIMANPGKAEEILCRQSKEWQKKPFIKP
jgi:UDP-N-acetylmuramoyl-tripeptide--D-alanyl-D-alanine ligase